MKHATLAQCLVQVEQSIIPSVWELGPGRGIWVRPVLCGNRYHHRELSGKSFSGAEERFVWNMKHETVPLYSLRPEFWVLENCVDALPYVRPHTALGIFIRAYKWKQPREFPLHKTQNTKPSPYGMSSPLTTHHHPAVSQFCHKRQWQLSGWREEAALSPFQFEDNFVSPSR